MPPAPPLRVAVLLDEWRAPRWVREVLEGIQASSFARIVLVVLNAARARASGPRHPLFRAYTFLDERAFLRRRRAGVPDPLAATDLRPVLAGCPVVRAAPDLPAAAVAGHDLDVALRFGFPALAGPRRDLARHGVWTHDHADPLAGFWEVLEARHTTPATLRELGGGAICSSLSPTDAHSPARNRRSNLAKGTRLALRALRDLHADGRLAAGGPPDPGDPAPAPPTFPALARGLRRVAARWAGDRWRQQTRAEQWVLAWGRGDEPPRRLVVPPPDRFWADPFPIEHEGALYLFFEECEHRVGRGRIVCARVGADGPEGPPRVALELDSHLSYPFVFRFGGELYMLPETGARRTIELFRARRFPDEWEPAAVLFDGVRAADTTLAEIDGRWWMFTCIAVEGALAFDELHLFSADSPLGPWRPHRRNPVVADVRRARPAGRLFRDAAGWHRPAQDCAERYGRAVAIQRIERLTPDEYVETEVSRLEPWDPRIVATHTFNRAGDLTFVDALRLRHA